MVVTSRVSSVFDGVEEVRTEVEVCKVPKYCSKSGREEVKSDSIS